MTIQAWTFLISRNQSIDYKTIVAPDFISQAKIRSLLLKVTDDDFTEGEQINVREVYGSEVGNFTVVFRLAKARSQDIEEPGNEVLKDSFGREIYLIEGLVFQSSPDEISGIIRQVHFDLVHRELIEKYRDFWHHNQLCDSHVIYLQEDESSPIIHLKRLQTFAIAPRNQLSYSNQPRATTARQSANNKTNYTNFIVILVFAIVVLTIWNMIGGILPPQAKVICKSTITIETMRIQNSQEGIKYLQKLQDKYSQIWINLDSEKDGQPARSPQTKKSNSEKDGQQQNDYSNWTIRLFEDNQMKMEYHPIDTAIAQLNQTDKISDLKAIIFEPDTSKNSQCSF